MWLVNDGEQPKWVAGSLWPAGQVGPYLLSGFSLRCKYACRTVWSAAAAKSANCVSHQSMTVRISTVCDISEHEPLSNGECKSDAPQGATNSRSPSLPGAGHCLFMPLRHPQSNLDLQSGPNVGLRSSFVDSWSYYVADLSMHSGMRSRLLMLVVWAWWTSPLKNTGNQERPNWSARVRSRRPCRQDLWQAQHH